MRRRQMPTGRHAAASRRVERVAAGRCNPLPVKRIAGHRAVSCGWHARCLTTGVNTLSPHADDFYRALALSARESMIVTDDSGVIVFENEAAVRLTAPADATLARRTIHDFLHPDDSAAMRAAYDRARDPRDPAACVECRVHHGSGRWLPVDALVRSIEVPDAAAYVLLQLLDASERVEMRAKVSETNRLAALGRMTAGVSDDLARVMVTIQGQLDHLLLSDAAFGLRVIRRAAETGSALARQLKALAEAPPPSAMDHAIDVHYVLKDLRRATCPELWLDMQLGAGASMVKADHDGLRQGLTDLVIGFANAMPDGSVVSVTTRNVPLSRRPETAIGESAAFNYLAIEVSNAAPHSPVPGSRRVFEPHIPLPLSAGIMLALVILDEVSVKAGGFVEVSTNPHGAAVVTIYLVAD